MMLNNNFHIYHNNSNTINYINSQTGDLELQRSGTTRLKVLTGGIDVVGEVQCDTLDVDGDSNVTGTVRQAGSSVVTLASAAAVGDATALAIALG